MEIYWLNNIKKDQHFVVGEKAFGLSQLQQLDYPVISGFVISAITFKNFLESINNTDSFLADFPLSSIYLKIDNYKALQNVAQKSRQDILNKSLPNEWLSKLVSEANKLESPYLILRASISISISNTSISNTSISNTFYGLIPAEISLNNPLGLDITLKKMWGKLFSAHNLFYWQKMGIGIENLNLAILVQPIKEAKSSGIVLVKNNHFKIKSTWGLGHSIIRGEVKPDLFQIERQTREIKFKELGNKIIAYNLLPLDSQTLLDNYLESYLVKEEQQQQYSLDEITIEKLVKLIENIELNWQKITSLEWTIFEDKNDEISIIQCQPSLGKLPNKILNSMAIPESELKLILRGNGASPGEIQGKAIVIPNLPSQSLSTSIPSQRILVINHINSDYLDILRESKGIITEIGGLTSHGAILARELGIPAIVNAKNATKIIKTGDDLLISGDQGKIYILNQINQTHKEKTSNLEINPEININQQLPKTPELSIYNYPIATKLFVNLSQTNSINTIANLPIDGIGLIRSELMMLELLKSHSLKDWLKESQKELFAQKITRLISKFAAAFFPRPIYYRSRDPNIELSPFNTTHSFSQRGILNYLRDSTLFDLELEALAKVRAQGLNNVHLILPFVRSLEEFTFCQERIKKIDLNKQDSFEIWIMAEVPSISFLLPQYIDAGVRGISIGTNDITQLLLGVSRDQTIDKLNACHPAILDFMEKLITQTQTASIPCSICGQAVAEYPELIEKLVQWGISSISVESQCLHKTYWAIARAEQKLLLNFARLQMK